MSAIPCDLDTFQPQTYSDQNLVPLTQLSSDLRPYQREAVFAAEEALKTHQDRVQVISLPTGSGKTRVGLEIAMRFMDMRAGGFGFICRDDFDLFSLQSQAVFDVI